ncbi:hypothetical protein IM660_17400 [Ruania alkalisoli]|uniref:Uncharacterized protein n=1 Tax=Ruania alkalisoli TaxID=2779775 RepID=A0A7M1SS05_9MICO|nr:hypothetical protein [Ruania alkalisoli]QOR70349.1 hypothetical protein IM660_17400 [Ruania alkalisoli]
MTNASGAPEEGASSGISRSYVQLDAVEPAFLRDVAISLVLTGHDVDLDVDVATVEVASEDARMGDLFGVVRSQARSVSCYAVYPVPIPVAHRQSAVELAVRASDAEFDATIEVDLAAGSIAVRTSVTVGEVEIPTGALGGLLGLAFATAEQQLVRYWPAIEAVLSGSASASDAMAMVRENDRLELEAERAELDRILEARRSDS